MGKKRIIKKSGDIEGHAAERERLAPASPVSSGRRRVTRGVAHVRATYNNTLIGITDEKGNMLAWSTAGSLGFSGAKKATPFAAARVAEAVAEKVKRLGVQEIRVEVRGIGSGRDSAIRALANHGLAIDSIKDLTPIPHNGPRPKKVRRV
ncbi:MAG: 30S ribosomal protein S11 [Candidatus Sungbacteria bacterium]|nr:30S ribosomal protein S11 [Candidatus Sungbacteria bacterium]